MSLSSTTQAYLISGMGSTTAGQNLIAAIQNETTLSAIDFTRLSDATEPDVASNIQAAILGSYSLSPRDVQFLKDGFSLPDASLTEVINALAGGQQVAPAFPNFLPNVGPNAFPNGFSNSSPSNGTMPAGFSFGVTFNGPAYQQYDTMTFPAGSAFASTGPGKYWEVFTGGNSNKYYVWYFVSGGSNTDPAPAGFTGIEVTILSGDTAAQVATKTAAALNAVTPGTQLGSAVAYGILAATAITNSVGTSIVNGDLGESPGSTVTGAFTVSGATNLANAASLAAQTDAQTAFTSMQTQGLAGTTIAAELGGVTLTPGNYQSATSFGLSLTSGHSTLTFNGAGVYIIYSPSTLLTGASGSTDFPVMVLENGATAANIYWVVGSSATINQSTASIGAIFQGNVIAQDSITVTQEATVNGSLIALTAAITLSEISMVNTQTPGPVGPVMAGAASTASGSAVTTVLAPTTAQVARPSFSLAGGTYHGTQSVTITSGTAGAMFYYTTNNTIPTPQSTLYTGAISVSASETLQVLGVKAGLANSQVASASYVIT
jgi:type VI secretion system secreted protein VgrG